MVRVAYPRVPAGRVRPGPIGIAPDLLRDPTPTASLARAVAPAENRYPMDHVRESQGILRVGTGLPGPGRGRGTPNRATADVRRAVASIAQRNVVAFETWLHQVAESDPARAAELFLRMLEFHIPRQRHVASDGASTLRVVVRRDFTAEGFGLPVLSQETESATLDT